MYSAEVSDGNGTYFCDLGNVVAQQIFDAHFQGQCRRRAARASALHMQVDDPALKPVESDITTILRHRRPPPCVEQFLALAHDFAVFQYVLRGPS